MHKLAVTLTLLVACLAGSLLARPAHAQAVVAIIDINRVFEQHPVFDSQLKALQGEAESLQSSVAQQRQKLAAQAEQLQLMYRVGTAEYSEREKSLAMESAKIELEARDRMRDLMRREARLHYDIFGEVSQIIAGWCQETGTHMVLRHSAITVNEKDPESIMTQVNASVIWHRADRDITDLVVQRMKMAPSPVSGLPSGTTNR